PGVAFRWRILHKLILGLGLVVAFTLLLLAGTFKGLASYMTTMKTVSSKLAELNEANEFKETIQSLATPSASATSTGKEHEDRVALEKKEMRGKIELAKQALARYKERLQDTVTRGRDPENGYRPNIIIDKIND